MFHMLMLTMTVEMKGKYLLEISFYAVYTYIKNPKRKTQIA